MNLGNKKLNFLEIILIFLTILFLFLFIFTNVSKNKYKSLFLQNIKNQDSLMISNYTKCVLEGDKLCNEKKFAEAIEKYKFAKTWIDSSEADQKIFDTKSIGKQQLLYDSLIVLANDLEIKGEQYWCEALINFNKAIYSGINTEKAQIFKTNLEEKINGRKLFYTEKIKKFQAQKQDIAAKEMLTKMEFLECN